MPSAAYTAQADAFGRRPQWLVEIDLDRCDNDYTSAPCTAGDAGDGSRCHYSFTTCQDATNFVKTTRTYRFCLNDVPWPDPATAVYPLLKSWVAVPQKIDPAKLFVYPEKVRLEFMLDFGPNAQDSDKTLFNTANGVGEFWRNLFARNRNYPGRPLRIKRGFDAAGFVLSDFEQVGPDYILKAVEFTTGGCRITAESPLVETNKIKVPFAISDDNTVQDGSGMTDSQNTVDVLDASEFPDPSDYTRNTLYIEIESEIMSYTGRDTGTNQLTGLSRGAFGTSAAAHANGQKVKHVACFGSSTGGNMNSLEAMQDLIEWAGIAAADVDTAAFDSIKAILWPANDVYRIVRKPKPVARLVQQLREPRGILVYINPAGKWSAKAVGPNETETALDDDSLILDSVSMVEDDEERATRVSLFYNPTEEDAKSPEKFNGAVIVVDTALESANNFNDQRDHQIFDHWVSPTYAIAKVRNLARTTIAWRRNGIRLFKFELDLKNGTLNVGDSIRITTREYTGIDGTQETRPCIVTERTESAIGRVRYVAMDTTYSGRYFRIGPDTMATSYDSATAADKAQGGYIGDNDNRVGTIKEAGYIFR